MAEPIFSTDVRPLSDLKTRSSEVVEQVTRTGRPVLITRRGRGVAVMVELAAFERMKEAAAFGAAVDEGAAEASRGDFAAPERVAALLRRKQGK